MNILKSKWFLGLVCFVLGIGAVLLAQKLTPKRGVSLLASNPPHLVLDRDPLLDGFYSNDPLGKASDPFEEIRTMRKQMLKEFIEPDEGGRNAGEIKKREDKNFIYYDLALKDLDKEKLDVKVVDGQISISGRIEKKAEENNSSSYFSSSFHRSFPVPSEVDAGKFQIEQGEDHLTLKFPRFAGA
jgi:HSP20 family molecular chaperone IbpA